MSLFADCWYDSFSKGYGGVRTDIMAYCYVNPTKAEVVLVVSASVGCVYFEKRLVVHL